MLNIDVSAANANLITADGDGDVIISSTFSINHCWTLGQLRLIGNYSEIDWCALALATSPINWTCRRSNWKQCWCWWWLRCWHSAKDGLCKRVFMDLCGLSSCNSHKMSYKLYYLFYINNAIMDLSVTDRVPPGSAHCKWIARPYAPSSR